MRLICAAAGVTADSAFLTSIKPGRRLFQVARSIADRAAHLVPRNLTRALLLSFSTIATLALPTPAAAQMITEHNIPATSQPVNLAVGPDGALWYTAYGRDKIGRITTGGAVTEFALPAGSSRPYG